MPPSRGVLLIWPNSTQERNDFLFNNNSLTNGLNSWSTSTFKVLVSVLPSIILPVKEEGISACKVMSLKYIFSQLVIVK